MLAHLPNALTLLRIAAIPVVVLLFFISGPTARWCLVGIYALACVTDYLDGLLARSLNRTSALGRFLDPIADKLLIAAVILMLVAERRLTGLHTLAGLIILLREIAVSGLRETLAEVRVSVPVSRLAKWKTALQMLALGILLAVPAVQTATWSLLLAVLGLSLLWIAVVLTVITGFNYLKAAFRPLTGM